MDRKRSKRSDVNDRLHINCFNFVFTCVILIAANSLAGGHFTERIHKIGRDLSNSLDAVLNTRAANYTGIYENVTYFSTTSFNAKGMAVLYNVTTKFMDAIASKDVYPEGFIKVEDGRLQLGSFEEQWKSILAHYSGLLAVIIVLLLFTILMPICGFFFCCCRCCGKCGARSKPFDKKGDLCKKICLASLLICVGTLLLFGVVCAFVTNQSLQENTYELSPSLKNGIRDTDSYLAYTGRQINVLFRVNYKEFEGCLLTTLDECSELVSNQLGEYSNATSLTEVLEIVDGLEYIKTNLTYIKDSTNELRTNASQLNDGLRKVKKDLLLILANCSGALPECSRLSNEYISTLGTDIHFDELPDVTEELDKLENLLTTDIRETVYKGKQAFDTIKEHINDTVVKQMPEVKKTITDVGVDIIQFGTNISSVISKARDSLHEYLDAPLKDMDKYVDEYTPYRYYLGIAVSCILLLVCLCITLGLICGICGKRPDAYGDDCCNKGAGSRFLMIGVAIMFLFSIVLAAVAIVYFFLGVFAQRIACDSLRKPNDSQVIHLADQVFNLKKKIGVNVNISSALTAIRENRSLYYTFDMKDYFDLDKVDTYMDKFEIKDMLLRLKETIKADTNITLIGTDAERHLNQLIESGIDNIDYDKFLDELGKNLTTVDLGYLADRLDHLVKTVNEVYPNKKEIATGLMLSSLHLRTYQANLIIPMINTSNNLLAAIRRLQTSFSSETIAKLIEDLKRAQKCLREDGPDIMIEIAENFAAGLEKQVRLYLDRVVINVKGYLGISGPISNVVNATLVATCDKILLPWNGFWFSILWCLILFIPAIILSVKLAGLYQKYEAYPGPLVEASVNDKRYKKKKKHKRFDGRGTYVAESPADHGVAREVPSGSARYADMAPKHWEEFPAGGPPHYQRAPTEYERPPPYYYPGTEQP